MSAFFRKLWWGYVVWKYNLNTLFPAGCALLKKPRYEKHHRPFKGFMAGMGKYAKKYGIEKDYGDIIRKEVGGAFVVGYILGKEEELTAMKDACIKHELRFKEKGLYTIGDIVSWSESGFTKALSKESAS